MQLKEEDNFPPGFPQASYCPPHSDIKIHPNTVESDLYRCYNSASISAFDLWGTDLSDTIDNTEDELATILNLDDVVSMISTMSEKDSREIRNHDCMWAGHCVSEKHERNQVVAKPQTPTKFKEIEEKVITLSAHSITNNIIIPKNKVIAPTNGRSLLLSKKIDPEKCVKVSYSHQDFDMDSNRPETPETPQSLSESEEDLEIDGIDADQIIADIAMNPNFCKEFYKDIINSIDDDFDFTFAPSEVTGQSLKPPRDDSPPPVKEPATIPSRTQINSSFDDHCYCNPVRDTSRDYGVLTPSDSEEEIDVVSIIGDKRKPSSRSSSSGGVLPTNPSLMDRQQLQYEVASAISKKDSKRHKGGRSVTMSNRFDRTLDINVIPNKRKIQLKHEARRTGSGKKRSVQYDDYEYFSKAPKIKKYLSSRRFKAGKGRKPTKRSRAGNSSSPSSTGSSDSEVDSTERRSLHNNMERQRRIDLRNAFEDLRKLVPDTAENPKSPKVIILCQGARYCKKLTSEEAEYNRKRAELRRQQEMLRAKVSQLRRSLAARR